MIDASTPFYFEAHGALSEPLSIHEGEALSIRLCIVLIGPLHSRMSRWTGGEDPIELVNKILRKSFMPNM